MIIPRSRFEICLALGILTFAPNLTLSSQFNYCGSSWTDANTKCEVPCPGGMDSECPSNEQCFADCTNCPPLSTPTLAPAPLPPPTVISEAGDDSRLVAFVGNWQACPTSTQTDRYTHLLISFAVSYTWNPTKNVCSTSCTIVSPVPVCNNQVNQNLVDTWRSQGKKVLLSFGGAGMGGSWQGDVNDCWEDCFGQETSVIQQLRDIVIEQNFDGVDIDYEYFYEDNGGFTFGTGEQARDFIEQVTNGLKSTLPPGQNIVTHTPMDSDMVASSSYYQIVKNNAGSIDFLMPQYYNGITRPVQDGIGGVGQGSVSALSHFQNLVNNVYSGDATKVVFGFCISDCSLTGSNADGNEAATVMTDLATTYPCNGGAFFWVALHDSSATWSDPVNLVIQSSSENCPDGPAPTNVPFPTSAPTKAPSLYPSTEMPTASPMTSNPPPYNTHAPSLALAGIGEPCNQPPDCTSGLCSGGNPSRRVCLENGSGPTPTEQPVPEPVEGPVQPPVSQPTACFGRGTPCNDGSQCCLGVCKGNGVCK